MLQMLYLWHTGNGWKQSREELVFTCKMLVLERTQQNISITLILHHHPEAHRSEMPWQSSDCCSVVEPGGESRCVGFCTIPILHKHVSMVSPSHSSLCPSIRTGGNRWQDLCNQGNRELKGD